MANAIITHPKFKDNEEYFGCVSIFFRKSKKAFLIDIEDYNFVISKTLSISRGYVKYQLSSTNKKSYLLHRYISRTPIGKITDHKNRDTLDNRRKNLRVCTYYENNLNKGASGNYRFKGLCQDRPNRWIAVITVHGRTIRLGIFNTDVEAAIAYNAAALKYHGEFAYQNIIP